MLTVLSLGATLGMVGYERSLRHSRTVEAVHSLQTIARDAAEFFDANGSVSSPRTEKGRGGRHFPPSSHAGVPADLALIRGTRYQSVPEDWQATPWRELNFSMTESQLFSYSFDSQGEGASATATARATGDQNGDGKLSRFALTVAASDKLVAVIAPRIEEEDGDE